MTKEKVEPQTYYSRSRGLMICAVHGEMTQSDGETKRQGEKHVQFAPAGVESDFGVFRTSDPELIEFLDNRIVETHDIFGPEEYNKLIVPADVRNAMLERQLTDANRLIGILKAQGKGPGEKKD